MRVNLSVVIPTLNNIRGLKYLLNFFKSKNIQIIIVDNKPNEKKIKLIKNSYKSLKIVYLPQEKNHGFARAINSGARNLKTKWMLILNDDIEFEVKSEKLKVKSYNSKLKIKNEETIQKLIKFAEENKLDAVSPVLISSNGEVENYGYKILPYGRLELIKNLKEKIQNTKYEILDTNFDGLSAACLLIRTSVFKKLKGFDESFFAYLEDVDFFLRLSKLYKSPRFSEGKSFPKPRRLSARFAICPDVEVLHNHMTTTKTMGNFKSRQDMINWWRLYFKHKDKFEFNLKFFIERLKNLSGFFKATIKSIL